MADFKINFLVNSRPKDREWQWINVLEAQCKYDLPERFQFQNKLCCKFKTESDRTRTCNPQIRSLMPYPLGHTPSCVIIKSYLYINVEDSVLFVVNILLVSRLYVGKFQRWFFWNPYMYPDLQLSTGMTWNELPISKKGIPKVIDKVDANVIIQFFAKNGQ